MFGAHRETVCYGRVGQFTDGHCTTPIEGMCALFKNFSMHQDDLHLHAWSPQEAVRLGLLCLRLLAGGRRERLPAMHARLHYVAQLRHNCGTVLYESLTHRETSCFYQCLGHICRFAEFQFGEDWCISRIANELRDNKKLL